MSSFPQLTVESDENALLDSSTAPTTPEGSLTFSPVLAAVRTEDHAHSALLTRAHLGATSLGSPLASTDSTRPRVRTICCVGAGYVGGPTAAMIAYQNPSVRVTVVDRDVNRIRRWNSQHPPIYEPGLSDIVRVARDGTRQFDFVNSTDSSGLSETASATSSMYLSECESQCAESHGTISVPARAPNLFFSSEVGACINEADIILIAVNTPTKSRGAGAGMATDMTAFEAVTTVVAQHARRGAIIVEKSTVPCGTAKLVEETLAVHRPGVHFEILSNPEFLAAGTAIKDLLVPDRILIGSSPTPSGSRAAETLASVYAAWVPRNRIITTNIWSSELAKLVANSMLAQRISSINSIAAICERTGANVDEVAAAVGCDPRIGDKFLKAGIGFGGSCFRKDVLSLVYIAQSLGLDEVADYWSRVISINEYARNRFASQVVKALNNTLVGKKITILGYAFKKNTSDTRESPALEIIRTLLEEGPNEIAVYDPCCNRITTEKEIDMLIRDDKILKSQGGPVSVYGSVYEACAASDAILITTDFDEFRTRGELFTSEGKAAGRLANNSGMQDPRPFERLEPTQSELLSLHKYLAQSSGYVLDAVAESDPLQRLLAEPNCPTDCSDCEAERQQPGHKANQDYKPTERLDWAKISYHMRKPKWVFDGRGVVDVQEMSRLGVRVESVGRRSIR